jgi:hypothetical protein
MHRATVAVGRLPGTSLQRGLLTASDACNIAQQGRDGYIRGCRVCLQLAADLSRPTGHARTRDLLLLRVQVVPRGDRGYLLVPIARLDNDVLSLGIIFAFSSLFWYA